MSYWWQKRLGRALFNISLLLFIVLCGIYGGFFKSLFPNGSSSKINSTNNTTSDSSLGNYFIAFSKLQSVSQVHMSNITTLNKTIPTINFVVAAPQEEFLQELQQLTQKSYIIRKTKISGTEVTGIMPKNKVACFNRTKNNCQNDEKLLFHYLLVHGHFLNLTSLNQKTIGSLMPINELFSMAKLKDSEENTVNLANLKIKVNRYYSYSILDYQTSYAEGRVELSFANVLEHLTQYAKQQNLGGHSADIEEKQSKFVWQNPKNIITVYLKEAKFQSTNIVIQQTQLQEPKAQIHTKKSNI